MKKLNHLSVRELLSGYKAKEFSPEEVTKAYLEEISSKDETGILCPCAWDIPFF